MEKTKAAIKMMALYLGLSLLAACAKDEKPMEIDDEIIGPIDSIGSVSHLPGFGDSEELPEGTPFVLPKGLKLVKRPHYRFDPDIKKLHGNMNTFYVDVHVVADSSWNGGIVVFPEALIMLNTAPSRLQNGMLMDRVAIYYPPYRTNGGRDTITQYLGVACMNANRATPWTENFGRDDRNYPIGKNMYIPYVVSKNKEVLKFISLLKGKNHLRLTRHYNPWAYLDDDYIEPEWMRPYGIIQTEFWRITDGQGLSKTEIEEFLEEIKKP